MFVDASQQTRKQLVLDAFVGLFFLLLLIASSFSSLYTELFEGRYTQIFLVFSSLPTSSIQPLDIFPFPRE